MKQLFSIAFLWAGISIGYCQQQTSLEAILNNVTNAYSAAHNYQCNMQIKYDDGKQKSIPSISEGVYYWNDGKVCFESEHAKYIIENNMLLDIEYDFKQIILSKNNEEILPNQNGVDALVAYFRNSKVQFEDSKIVKLELEDSSNLIVYNQSIEISKSTWMITKSRTTSKSISYQNSKATIIYPFKEIVYSNYVINHYLSEDLFLISKIVDMQNTTYILNDPYKTYKLITL